MFGEHALAEWLEPRLGPLAAGTRVVVASALALTILTIAHIVIGEMVPKGVALQQPEATVRATVWALGATIVVLYPIVWLSNGLALASLRLMGIRRETNASERVYTPEELQLLVEESDEGGALRGDSGHILRELFEFGDRTAGQAMVPRVRVVGLPVGTTPDALRAFLGVHGHTRYPVYDGDLDHIIGMLHAKDLLRRLLSNEPVSAADVRKVPVIPETSSLDDVLATMQRTAAHMAVVIDEHGGTAGVITLEDLFEEVVGEIDEGAPDAPAITALRDGSVRALGTVRLDELGREFDLDLEHDEVDSVSGLVLARLGRPPAVGDVVEYGRLRIEVTATRGRGVREVKATITP
jgi:CBS domain containing-hemolysin-like protein